MKRLWIIATLPFYAVGMLLFGIRDDQPGNFWKPVASSDKERE